MGGWGVKGEAEAHVTSRSCIAARASERETAAALRDGANDRQTAQFRARDSERGAEGPSTHAQFAPKISPTLKPGMRRNSFATQTPRMAEMVLPTTTQRWVDDTAGEEGQSRDVETR